MSRLNDVAHWRDRAEEMRVLSEALHTERLREQMLEIAKGYDRLAERAEARLRGDAPQ